MEFVHEKQVIINAEHWPKKNENHMLNKIISLTLLIGGVVLMIIGINATNSFSSDVSRFFTGNPTDRSMWMIVGGVVTVIVGLFLAITGMRKR